jgi:head-tail adaptor
MDIGSLRHVVTIQVMTGTLSPTGGVTEGTPTDIATHVPMSIVAPPAQAMANERLAAGGLQGQTTYVVQCRYRRDFGVKAVLLEECCQQRRLEILTLAPTLRNEALEMLCVERAT